MWFKEYFFPRHSLQFHLKCYLFNKQRRRTTKLGQCYCLTMLHRLSAGVRVKGHRKIIRGHWSLQGKILKQCPILIGFVSFFWGSMRQEGRSTVCFGSNIRKRSVEVKMSYFTTITKHATCFTKYKDPGPPYLVSGIA